MALANRLKRLETAAFGNREAGQHVIETLAADLLADVDTVQAWLEAHGYGNALEAMAAGETGPALRTEGWSLATLAEIERDIIEEKIYAGFNPDVSLWHHHGRGWCAPINGRLEYLGDNHDSAVARYHELVNSARNTEQERG